MWEGQQPEWIAEFLPPGGMRFLTTRVSPRTISNEFLHSLARRRTPIRFPAENPLPLLQRPLAKLARRYFAQWWRSNQWDNTALGTISLSLPGGCQENLQPASTSFSKYSSFRAWSPAVKSTWPDFSSMACRPPLSTTCLPSMNRREPSSDSRKKVYVPSL